MFLSVGQLNKKSLIPETEVPHNTPNVSESLLSHVVAGESKQELVVWRRASLREQVLVPQHCQDWKKLLYRPWCPDASLPMLKPLLFLKSGKTVLLPVDRSLLRPIGSPDTPLLLPPDPPSLFPFYLVTRPNAWYLRHLWTFSRLQHAAVSLESASCPVSPSALALGSGARVLSSVQTLTHSLSAICGHKWSTSLLWNTTAKNPILKKRLVTNSFRTSCIIIKTVVNSQSTQFEMHLDVKKCFQKVEDKWNFDKFILNCLVYTSHFSKSVLRIWGN